MQSKRPLLLVDGNSIAWRAFHAIRGLRAQGVPTGMAYGFLRMLRNTLEDVGARTCTVVWDKGVPAYREQLCPTYKLGRKTTLHTSEREEFKAQQAWLNEVLPLLGATCMWCKGWEADDAIAWQVTRFKANGPVTILSGDRDLWQLVDYGVNVLSPSASESVNMVTFKRLTGFATPQQWFWFRVLSGDRSDGVPGVGQVGEKRARELVERGWPDVRDSVPPEWWAARSEAVDRNTEVMRLGAAVEDLERESRGSYATERWVAPARRDLRAVRAALNAKGMHTLTARWSEWAEPFRRLEK